MRSLKALTLINIFRNFQILTSSSLRIKKYLNVHVVASSTKSRAEDKSPEVSCSGRDMASGASECPGRDSKVVRELEEAECQARQTANVISELKSRVTALMCKEHMSEREGQELECMNRQLMAHMSNFEEKTRLIQMLVNTADENLKPRADGAVSLEAHREEMLPKVVVCGATEDNMPKLLICDPPKKCRRGHSTDRRRRQSCERPPTCGDMCGQPPAPPGFVPRMAQRLSESYDMQEKLAADNVDLEGKRLVVYSSLVDTRMGHESNAHRSYSLPTRRAHGWGYI